jgi:hypothetical protein
MMTSSDALHVGTNDLSSQYSCNTDADAFICRIIAIKTSETDNEVDVMEKTDIFIPNRFKVNQMQHINYERPYKFARASELMMLQGLRRIFMNIHEG